MHQQKAAIQATIQVPTALYPERSPPGKVRHAWLTEIQWLLPDPPPCLLAGTDGL